MQTWVRKTEITTPESITIDFELAGPGTRFLALLLDLLIVMILMSMAFYVLVMVQSGFIAVEASSELSAVARAILVSFILITEFAIFFGYWFFLEAFQKGQTLGKRALGIRVMMRGGFPITVSASLIRNVVRLVDMLPPPCFAVGLFATLLSRNYQRLGDLAAGTFVVREHSHRIASSGYYFAGLTPQHVQYWDTSAISDFEIELIRRFLARRMTLNGGARYSVGLGLAERYRHLVAGADPNLPAEVFLEGIVLEREMRSSQQQRAA